MSHMAGARGRSSDWEATNAEMAPKISPIDTDGRGKTVLKTKNKMKIHSAGKRKTPGGSDRDRTNKTLTSSDSWLLFTGKGRTHENGLKKMN